MKLFLPCFLFLFIFIHGSVCEIIHIDGHKVAFAYCTGVYSKNDVIGSEESSMSLLFEPSSNGKLSLLIFNILDAEALQISLLQSIGGIFCTTDLINNGVCSVEGSLLFKPNNTAYPYETKYINLNASYQSANESYPIEYSGHYCVLINSIDPSHPAYLNGYIVVKNPYGYLAARKYPPLILNIILACAYFAIGILWTYYTIKYRKEIIQVQNYISLLFFVLMLEALATFLYYLNNNLTGYNSNALFLIFLVITSLRATLSLFLMLIVAMGYGIYKPHLEVSVLNRVLMLSLVHFIFGFLTSSASLYNRNVNVETSGINETSDMATFCFLLPFLFSTLLFYYWTGASLKNTIALLTSKQQYYKLSLYARLTKILNVCFFVVFGMILLSAMVLLSHRADLIWRGEHWTSIWFWLEGWPSILYFFGFISVTYLLRPRKDNRRYGLEQLPSSDDSPLPDDDIHTLESTAYPLQSIKILGKSNSGSKMNSPYYPLGKDSIGDDGWTEQQVGYAKQYSSHEK